MEPSNTQDFNSRRSSSRAFPIPDEPQRVSCFLQKCFSTLQDQGFRPGEGVWSKHNILLGFLFVLAFGLATGERVLFKFMVQHALVDRLDRDYRFVLLQCLCVVHFVFSMLMTVWRVSRGSSNFMDSVRFPKWNFVVIGFLNFIHLTLTVIPAAGVPAPATTVLFHSVTPITMVLMVLLRKAQYSRCQIFGGSLIAIGILINVGPLIIVSTEPDTSLAAANRSVDKSLSEIPGQGARALSGILDKVVTLPQQCENYGKECSVDVLMYVLAGVPAAIATVFQETMLAKNPHSVTPELMDSWVLPIQLGIGMILTPVGEFVQSPLEPWRNVTNLAENIEDGLECIVNGEQRGIQIVSITDVDWCRPLLSFTVAFVLVTVILNQVVLRAVESGGEKGLNTVLWLSLPMSWATLASLSDSLQPKTTPMHIHPKSVSEALSIEWADVVGLLLVMTGLWLHQQCQEPLADACTPLYIDEDLVELERELRAQDSSYVESSRHSRGGDEGCGQDSSGRQGPNPNFVQAESSAATDNIPKPGLKVRQESSGTRGTSTEQDSQEPLVNQTTVAMEDERDEWPMDESDFADEDLIET